MGTMNVLLGRELESYVASRVAKGLSETPGEVVREALWRLRTHDQLRELQLEELRREVAVGDEQLQRGEYTTYASGADFAEAIKRDGRALLANCGERDGQPAP